ncbi:uncharacterized protein LOC142467899 isoform X2 [Ascaphus truei]|uniref:uncharacterized protein LOC142467899 isoform X2 n=1 Tax=Ascaphus truei TaxID=8439 RepID=UPI003F590A7E
MPVHERYHTRSVLYSGGSACSGAGWRVGQNVFVVWAADLSKIAGLCALTACIVLSFFWPKCKCANTFIASRKSDEYEALMLQDVETVLERAAMEIRVKHVEAMVAPSLSRLNATNRAMLEILSELKRQHKDDVIKLFASPVALKKDVEMGLLEQLQPEQTQPKQTQPEQTQPEQTHSEQTHSEQTQPEQTHSEQTQPKQTQPEQTQPEQTQPEQTHSEQTQPEQTHSEQTQPKQTHSEQTQPEQTQPEQTQPEQTQPKQTHSEQTHSEQTQP